MNKSKLASGKKIIQRAVGYIKPVVFVLALCATVLAFSLPIVFYYLTSYSVINNHQATENLLPNVSNVVNNSTIPCDNSTILSWGIIEDSVTECEPYTGTICLPYLIQWNQCILPGGGDQEEIIVAVNSNGKTQDILEEELSQLNTLLENFPECHSIAIPFLCHHYFPLTAAECQSTVDDNQPIYTVTQEDCINIRDTICAVPWQLADTLGYSDRLPDCQSLSNTNVSIEQMNMTRSLIPISNQSVSCRDDFILINNTCYPRCDRFKEQSNNFITAIVISEVFGNTVSALLSLIAFISALYNRKRMLKFPFFFLLLVVTDSFVATISILIFGINGTKLLCSSLNLLEAIDKPTIYCYINGALFHYCIMNVIIWWFFHLCIFFYEIMFPFHAHRMRELGRTKTLSILLLIAGFLIPIPGVIVGLTSAKHQYNFNRFPPTMCNPSANVWFYFGTLPISVLFCIGICLLIIILWKINRVYSNNAKKSGTKQRLTVAEKKLMIVSVLVIIFGSYLMVYHGIATGNADRASRGFTNYFLCESTGHVPGKCDRKEFERYIYPQLSVMRYISIVPLPLSVLNFIVNWETVWKSMKHLLGRTHTAIMSISLNNTEQTSINSPA